MPAVFTREKFLRRQIEHAGKIAEHYRALKDFDSAAVFVDWADRAELEIETMKSRKPFEPAEPDPGPGWLRSRFMGQPWPRPGVAACGRRTCPVCGPPPLQCEALPPAPRTSALAADKK
jgi:hypothetical protein